MRWQVKEDIIGTKEESIIRNGEQVGTKEITTKRKYKVQYITVGDIVGMGKSAAGAVNKLAKKIPQLIRSFNTGIDNIKSTVNNIKNGDPAFKGTVDNAFTEMTLSTINNLVQPLNIMIKGMDVYKKVMTVVDTVTPIVKTLARTTGIWCSPGNVADIAQIILGQAKQALIGIAVSALVSLKEWVWAFEFPIREMDLGTSQKISEKLKKAAELQKGEDILGSGSGTVEGIKNFKNTEEKIKKDIHNLFNDQKLIISDNISDEDARNLSVNNYITEISVGENKRVIGGSIINNGIFYSDDKKKTWNKSNQTTGCFKSFAKIKVGESYIYVAGSTNQVLKTALSYEPFSKDVYGRYDKDYYDKSNKRLTKKQKDSGIREYYSITEEVPSMGILWSEDGINWNSSDLTSGKFESMQELVEKEGHKPTIVASSFDYQGIYYTEDGKTWKRPTIKDKEIKDGRWVDFSACTGTDPMLYNGYNDLNVTFNTGKIINVVNIIPNNSGIKVEFNNTSFGHNLNIIKEETVMEIIRYVHETQDVSRITNDQWKKIIEGIQEGKYTLSDAENNKDIMEIINGK